VDGSASNEEGSLVAELHAAMLVSRLRGSTSALAARDALALATMGGAMVLGRSFDLGSIEVGKLADLALWRVDGLAHAGIADPVAALVLGARPPLAMLMVSGQVLVEDDVLLTADERELAAEASRAARKLMERKSR
jgi:cytosine/adenosine deaminase-related metal-dependent hydrolase